MSADKKIANPEKRVVPTSGETRGLTPITVVPVPPSNTVGARKTPIPTRIVPTNKKKGT